MKCAKTISKEKVRIIAGLVVFFITVLAVCLVVIFEIRKSPDNESKYRTCSSGKHMTQYLLNIITLVLN